MDFRPYQRGDEEAICGLFSTTYGKEMPIEFWRWRFLDNPSGSGVIELAWDGSLLAAHYAVTPVTLSVAGRSPILSGLSGTTMTHPAYRGRGLFPELARRTYSRMADSGFSLVWGFPNANSHRGFVTDLGWKDIHEIPTLRLTLSESALAPTEVTCVETDDYGAAAAEAWSIAQTRYPVAVVRDEAYLDWRYSSNPFERYRFLVHQSEAGCGVVVFKRYHDDFQIVDYLVSSGDVLWQLLIHLVQMARDEKVEGVGAWVSVFEPEHWLFERAGFRNTAPVTYFAARPLGWPAGAPDLSTFSNWHLAMGDSDVY